MLEKVDRLLDSLLPRACVVCGLDGGEQACCTGCREDLPWIGNPCRRCGRAMSPGRSADFCSRCGEPTGEIARIVSALVYEYPVDRIIGGAKFRQRLDFAAALGALLADFLAGPSGLSAAELPDIVIPVPLHRRRLAARGFNQAAEIAAPIARRFGLPLRIDACNRIRHTIEQTSLTGRARGRNLAGAFVARNNLAGRRVAIVDDVLTTGATVRAVAAAARRTGVRDVQVWTVARTA